MFPEDHPLSLGVMGLAGHAIARDTLLSDRVDVLLTLGASLNETTTLNWDPRLLPNEALIQLDISVDRIGRNYPVDVALVGDAQNRTARDRVPLAPLIRDGRRPSRRPGARPPLDQATCAILGTGRALRATRSPHAAALAPRPLEEVLPDNAIVFSDIGGHMLFNIHHLCIKERQRFVLNLGFGSMGHGTVAPIGAALAHPNRPVFAIVGDGCFTMNGMDLLTAAECDVPVIWIVENNNMHGITWHGSKLVGQRKPLDAVVYRRPLEIAAIARAMGLHASVVDAPDRLQQAVRDALALGGPALIEVRVDGRIAPPLGDRAKTIAGFTQK